MARLKRLQSYPLFVGRVFHEIVAKLIKRVAKRPGEPIDETQFWNWTATRIDDSYGRTSFMEEYYSSSGAPSRDAARKSVTLALENLRGSERYQWLEETAKQSGGSWVIEPGDYGETRVGNYIAYCKVDFVVPRDDLYFVIDWKTGKVDPEKHSVQLCGYTIWAMNRLGIELEKIRPIVAHVLPEYSEQIVTLSPLDLDEFAGLVEEQTLRLYDYCREVDSNTPVPKEQFGLTSNVDICRWCNYRELCGR